MGALGTLAWAVPEAGILESVAEALLGLHGRRGEALLFPTGEALCLVFGGGPGAERVQGWERGSQLASNETDTLTSWHGDVLSQRSRHPRPRRACSHLLTVMIASAHSANFTPTQPLNCNAPTKHRHASPAASPAGHRVPRPGEPGWPQGRHARRCCSSINRAPGRAGQDPGGGGRPLPGQRQGRAARRGRGLADRAAAARGPLPIDPGAPVCHPGSPHPGACWEGGARGGNREA